MHYIYQIMGNYGFPAHNPAWETNFLLQFYKKKILKTKIQKPWKEEIPKTEKIEKFHFYFKKSTRLLKLFFQLYNIKNFLLVSHITLHEFDKLFVSIRLIKRKTKKFGTARQIFLCSSLCKKHTCRYGLTNTNSTRYYSIKIYIIKCNFPPLSFLEQILKYVFGGRT